MQTFQQLVEGLGHELGLNLRDAIESPFELTVDGQTVVVSHERRRDEEEIILYAKLGVVAEEQQLAVYQVMLDANVLWSQSDECTLGVNVATREGIICFRMPLDGLDGPRFTEIVLAFGGSAKNWANFIEATNAPDAEEPVESGLGDVVFRA